MLKIGRICEKYLPLLSKHNKSKHKYDYGTGCDVIRDDSMRGVNFITRE